MTPEQKAAFINAQAACAMIEAAGMTAENNAETRPGVLPTYSQEDFMALLEKYGIHHNAVVGFFHD